MNKTMRNSHMYIYLFNLPDTTDGLWPVTGLPPTAFSIISWLHGHGEALFPSQPALADRHTFCCCDGHQKVCSTYISNIIDNTDILLRMPLLRMLRHFALLLYASFLLFLAHSVSPGSAHGNERFPANTMAPVEVSFEQWLEAQSAHASQAVLDNIGADGVKALGASAGIVIASPSKVEPPYFFTWTRDSALVLKSLIDQFVRGNHALQDKIHEYISSQARLQIVPNRSGDLADGKGLGEPKFLVDGSRFDGKWGRPQNDGPALRATAMMAYVRWLIDNGHADTAREIVWPVVQNDLSFVAEYWNSTSFDLWEEVRGASFFTTAVQYRSLVEGDILARELGLTCDSCASQAPQVLCFLQSYWTGAYIQANHGTDRSGKDTNSILGIIHTFDPEAACDDATFQPCSQRALANHKAVTDAFRSIYEINSGIPSGEAAAVGRYPEDVYFGGNPWYLANFAAAEQLYDAIYQWNRTGSIAITEVSLPFFMDIYEPAAVGEYPSTSPQFSEIVTAVSNYADGYMQVAQQNVPCAHMLAEQYTRDNGMPTSASDLTWSYIAFLDAAARRASLMPAPWGRRSGSAPEVPAACSATSASGSYATATPTIPWPTTLTPTTRPACASPTDVDVINTFQVLAFTAWGQNVFLTGSIPALGEWDPERAVPLGTDDYRASCPVWRADIVLPTGARFEYKYLRKEQDGSVVWEQGPNRWTSKYFDTLSTFLAFLYIAIGMVKFENTGMMN
ncbi:hypothetical protein VTO42DRAFT_3957 [Malbranchea cinnamomea]